MLARSYQAGVRIAFGTDMRVGTHGYARSRNTSADSIKAATVDAAELLDIADVAGSLALGKSADIIAIDGDPLADVTELEHIAFVMAKGTQASSARSRAHRCGPCC